MEPLVGTRSKNSDVRGIPTLFALFRCSIWAVAVGDIDGSAAPLGSIDRNEDVLMTTAAAETDGRRTESQIGGDRESSDSRGGGKQIVFVGKRGET